MNHIAPNKNRYKVGPEPIVVNGVMLLMEDILHHLGCIKPYEYWDIDYINWCRISSINSSLYKLVPLVFFHPETTRVLGRPKTNEFRLKKTYGWKTTFLLKWSLFRGTRLFF